MLHLMYAYRWKEKGHLSSIDCHRVTAATAHLFSYDIITATVTEVMLDFNLLLSKMCLAS